MILEEDYRMKNELETALYGYPGHGSYFTGSALVIDNPQDVDLIVRPDETIVERLRAAGWEVNDTDFRVNYPNTSLKAVARKGKYNVVVPLDEVAFADWCYATDILSALQLKEKPQRVVLFQLLTEGCIRGSSLRLESFSCAKRSTSSSNPSTVDGSQPSTSTNSPSPENPTRPAD